MHPSLISGETISGRLLGDLGQFSTAAAGDADYYSMLEHEC